MPPIARLFALTTHGLESVAATEISSLEHATLQEIGYRRIRFDWSGPLNALLTLRTVDDLFVDLTTCANISHQRSELGHLTHLAGRLSMNSALAICRTIRPISSHPSFAISASFVGHRNYRTGEIKSAVAWGVQYSTGWPYRERDDSAELSIRIFIEHDLAHVGVRLGKKPLHERLYRLEHRGGALKPTVAAAMVNLTAPHPSMRVLDPCCGTGTIAIEAALTGLNSIGFDRDQSALGIAKRHGPIAGVAIDWGKADAKHLPLASASVDRIVSNLPWGRQAGVEHAIADFYASCLDELLRVLTPGGTLALLVEDPALIPAHRQFQHQCIEISLYGRQPTIILLRP